MSWVLMETKRGVLRSFDLEPHPGWLIIGVTRHARKLMVRSGLVDDARRSRTPPTHCTRTAHRERSGLILVAHTPSELQERGDRSPLKKNNDHTITAPKALRSATTVHRTDAGSDWGLVLAGFDAGPPAEATRDTESASNH